MFTDKNVAKALADFNVMPLDDSIIAFYRGTDVNIEIESFEITNNFPNPEIGDTIGNADTHFTISNNIRLFYSYFFKIKPNEPVTECLPEDKYEEGYKYLQEYCFGANDRYEFKNNMTVVDFPDIAGFEKELRQDSIAYYRYIDFVFYKISANNTENGTVTADKTKAKQGETVTLTVTPSQGYLLDTLTITKNDIPITVGEDFTFTMPDGDVEITATFKLKNFLATWTDGDGSSYEKGFKFGELITIPTNEFFVDTFRKTGYFVSEWQGYTEGMTMPSNNVTFTAVYAPNKYTVTFNPNGGEAIDPISVTYDDKYGRLPSSAITGLSGGDSNWYLVDKDGNVTDTKITKFSKVSQARNHTLFVKRTVLAPSVKLNLSVPGGISDSYQYYIPGNSTRILTATISNQNNEVLNYTYQWYKNGSLIEGETGSTLTLAGNVADSGKYKVVVTATLKAGAGIVVTSNSAKGEKELQVKILHQANTINYDTNGGEGGPISNYTGGTTAAVSKGVPTRKNYIFQGWNTKADGSGESYIGADTYTFQNDNGNGGCVITLYAQWKGEEKTITYQVGDKTFKTDTAEYGKDIVLPAVPQKEGYIGKWDHDGKNITADTVIKAVYTEIPKVNTPTSPETGDNNNLWLWMALLFVSGAGVFGLVVHERKRKSTKK